jgi:phage shock protein E
MNKIEEFIKNGQGTIVDVRSIGEFAAGHSANSINIPLQEVVERTEEILQLTQPILFCCASGGRSGQATSYFIQKGIECYNAGSWLDVQFLQSTQ